MKIKELTKKFKWELKIEQRRAQLLWILVFAIIKFRTVNLTKLIPCLWKKPAETRYKQFQRFFRYFRFEEWLLAGFIAWFLWEWPYVLSMDRTNWKYWKVDINILTIWIVYKWIAFPVLRRLLPKRWNSNIEERIELVQKFLGIFWKQSIWLFLADREFIWKERVVLLLNSSIEFILRVRNNTRVEYHGNKNLIFNSFKYDKRYNPRILKKKNMVTGTLCYLNENGRWVFNSCQF